MSTITTTSEKTGFILRLQYAVTNFQRASRTPLSLPAVDVLASDKRSPGDPQKPRLRNLPTINFRITIDLESKPDYGYFPPAADFWLRLQVPALIDSSPDAINKDWLPWPQTFSHRSPLGQFWRRSPSRSL
jgi:hypothetical protein